MQKTHTPKEPTSDLLAFLRQNFSTDFFGNLFFKNRPVGTLGGDGYIRASFGDYALDLALTAAQNAAKTALRDRPALSRKAGV